jgi:hypothetical protein
VYLPAAIHSNDCSGVGLEPPSLSYALADSRLKTDRRPHSGRPVISHVLACRRHAGARLSVVREWASSSSHIAAAIDAALFDVLLR